MGAGLLESGIKPNGNFRSGSTNAKRIVMVQAAFTVPGGYNNDKGYPILRNHRAFVISDAISLTFATISILVFLHILTSRYAEQDFLETLPKKLINTLPLYRCHDVCF
ncbi:hypothetical protein L1987_47689 [Smallanthus sonchifolius]|uniref:Uncharacterized protein n=1 Tax=Smallanthus sonchifolius TaxID=185202 RepID=A0ACB9G482_9ASTR|nr:hypothetical protein L1987_47689 [Smallanthus sonchifolius]